jgi:pseudouridine synthase
VASRRKSDLLIRAGRVTVNGATAAALGTEIDPEADRVAVDGRPVRPEAEFVYVLMNKPPGLLVSLQDPHHPRTVLDLLKGLDRRVFPVGRLDLDTTGVLLLTDDGDLTFRLCHPRHGVEKTYLARVEGVPDGEDLRALSEGIDLDGRRTAPARVRIVKGDAGGALLRITVHEGRKRQVKRMCREVGHRVRDLERIDFGGITAAGLGPGEWRFLTPEEVDHLKRTVGLET